MLWREVEPCEIEIRDYQVHFTHMCFYFVDALIIFLSHRVRMVLHLETLSLCGCSQTGGAQHSLVSLRDGCEHLDEQETQMTAYKDKRTRSGNVILLLRISWK